MRDIQFNESIYQFILIFARLGVAFSIFPGLNNNSILMRARVAIALTCSIVIFPLVSSYLPKYSENFTQNIIHFSIEMLVGVIISIGANFYYSCLHIVGQIIAMQSGLGSAMLFDPSQKMQVSIFSSMLFMIVTVTIFATNTHHVFIQAIIDSYQNFPPSEFINIGDLGKFITRLMNDTFILAFKIASPFIIVSFAILIGSGILSKLMPTLQVFFVITPAQILTIYAVLYLVINAVIEKIIASITSF